MQSEFEEGAQDWTMPAPPIEKIGPRYQIRPGVTRPGPTEETDRLSEPYLMPTVHGRNGSMEKVDPAITHTPLGAMMPGPFAIPPAIPSGVLGAQQVYEGAQGFDAGVADAFPEGSPVPYRI